MKNYEQKLAQITDEFKNLCAINDSQDGPALNRRRETGRLGDGGTSAPTVPSQLKKVSDYILIASTFDTAHATSCTAKGAQKKM